MTYSKPVPTPILKINRELPSALKRSHASFAKSRSTFFQPLPPSLLKLPTIGNSITDFSDDSINCLDLSDRSTNSLDLELNDTNLDKWLVSLDKVTKASEDERNTRDITNSVSRVSFAPSSPKHESTTSFEQPAKKRRRFQRRNSFVVRDLSQLSRIVDEVINTTTSTHDM